MTDATKISCEPETRTTAAFMARHQAHDYGALIRQWKSFAKRAGIRMESYVELGGYEVFYLETAAADGGVYLSAGLHGDEAAPPWALLEWAQKNVACLKREPLMIFPCLNPWGLVNNVRLDHRGRDMNRLFQNGRADGIRQWRKVVGKRRFRLSVNLHEDYDGQGMYVYELTNTGSKRAEAVLAAASAVIPPDRRRDIDGSAAKNGVIRKKITSGNFPLPGLPEAVYLHFEQSEATLTIESPSEFALCERVAAHVLGIDAALDWI